MQKILLSVFLFLSLSAFADAEKVKQALNGISFCQNFIRTDEDFVYLGYGYYSNSSGGFHQAKPTDLTVISLENPQEKRFLKLEDSAVDLVSLQNHLYVLTYTGIEDWDKSTWTRLAVYPTYEVAGSLNFEEHATQMALYKNQLVISHGRLGISIFDLDSHKIVFQQKLAQNRLPLESKATGVAVAGDKAYLALDSFTMVQDPSTQKPFQGLIVFDLANRQVMKELDGMEPGSDALYTYDNKLIISFYGIPLLKYNFSQLEGSRLPGPITRISRFPEQGRLLGKPDLKGDYIYTCFQRVPFNDGEPISRVPRVWLRKDLKLMD